MQATCCRIRSKSVGVMRTLRVTTNRCLSASECHWLTSANKLISNGCGDSVQYQMALWILRLWQRSDGERLLPVSEPSDFSVEVIAQAIRKLLISQMSFGDGVLSPFKITPFTWAALKRSLIGRSIPELEGLSRTWNAAQEDLFMQMAPAGLLGLTDRYFNRFGRPYLLARSIRCRRDTRTYTTPQRTTSKNLPPRDCTRKR